MHVLATAGHVDHGKSTLVRALTGIEPDRWEAERRRGLTIDLGYAWTTLPGGETVAFVDVPGHRRFIVNMLAGVGPVPGVVFVVAADAGWSAQSTEHLRAVEAFGIDRGLLVITRSDLADPAPALHEARERLDATRLAGCEAVAVSAMTGSGLDELRAALSRVCATMPTPQGSSRVRLWVDRAFTISGAGTVVTGTLGAGSIAVGDELEIDGRRVRVRGLQSLETSVPRVEGVARVAVNLRGIAADDVTRGQALTTPGAWRPTTLLDARFVGAPDARPELPPRLTLHLGTAAPIVHTRPLGDGAVRIALPTALPLVAGDRAILRDPGEADGEGIAGIVVLDADPPALRRRGDAARRGTELGRREQAAPDLATEVRARGSMRVEHAIDLGIPPSALPADSQGASGLHGPAGDAMSAAESRPAGDVSGGSSGPCDRDGDAPAPPVSQDAVVLRLGEWLVADTQWNSWARALREIVAARQRAEPLDPSVPVEAARAACDLPDRRLVAPLAQAAGLAVTQGRVHDPDARPDLGAAEEGLRRIEARLATEPFAAPEADELTAAGLGARQLAAAVGTGRLLKVGEGIYLQSSGPAKAMRTLAGLCQPFTTSEARQALGTTRRVAIPLLEHLDSRGWTRRLDAGHREVVR